MTDERPTPSARSAFEDTVDWNRYWREWREDGAEPHEYPASVSHHHFEHVLRFLDRVGAPADAAFVGCGPGDLAAAVAEAYPRTDVVGYDAAESVVAANRAAYADRQNLSFDVGVLPDLALDHRFGLVFCYATLHYVRDAEAAVADLYRHVADGGHLVCHYPDEEFRERHRDATGELRERFRLVHEGANLLSAARIEELLGAAVRDFWAFVDADGPAARSDNPCVFVRK